MRCLIYRMAISHELDNRKPIPDWLRHHLIRCPSCRRFFASSITLKDKLKAETNETVEVQWTALTNKVMEKLEVSPVALAKPSFSSRKPHWMAALAACLILVMIGALLLFNRTRQDQPPAQEMAASLDAVTEIGRKLVDPYLPQEGMPSLVSSVAEPLTSEVQRLSRDAASIGGFVLAILPLGFAAGQENDGEEWP